LREGKQQGGSTAETKHAAADTSGVIVVRLLRFSQGSPHKVFTSSARIALKPSAALKIERT